MLSIVARPAYVVYIHLSSYDITERVHIAMSNILVNLTYRTTSCAAASTAVEAIHVALDLSKLYTRHKTHLQDSYLNKIWRDFNINYNKNKNKHTHTNKQNNVVTP